MPLQIKPLTVAPTDQMLQAQRQQALADLLTRQAVAPVQTPSGGGMITPRTGILQAIAPMAEALLASRTQKKADQSTKSAFQAQQDAQNQALAGLLGGASGGAPVSAAASAPPPTAGPPSFGGPGGGYDPSSFGAGVASDLGLQNGPSPSAAPPQGVAPQQGPGASPSPAVGPNFSAALRAQQLGVDPALLGKIIDSQMPTDKIKTYQQGGMSGDDIARAIRGEAAKDSSLTVGSDSRLVSPLDPTHVLLGSEDKLPPGMRMGANGQPEWIPGYLEGEAGLRRAGQPSVNVNTDKSLYGTLGEKQAGQYSEQFAAAQAAPEAIAGAQRVRDVLKTVPYTGSGAQWKLSVGKAARAAGLNYAGDDLANTEALGTEMAKATLAQVHTSGLGAGQGFSNADRAFLEKAAGGNISLEPQTIARLADLNERAARVSIKRWNDTYSGLDPARMQQLGMRKVEQPQNAANAPIATKLRKNADGTLTYTP